MALKNKTILQRVAERLERIDGWMNPFTGFGTGRDKTEASRFRGLMAIDDLELSGLYHGDDMAKRIVDFLPDEALRQGVTIKCKDPENATAIADKFKVLEVQQMLADGFRWGRAFGGAAIFLGADDGQNPTEPLDIERVNKFSFLQLYDRRRCWPVQWNEDPEDPRYGYPEIYMLQSLKGGTSEVHESRLMLFGGAKTADFEKLHLNFWDFSVLQVCYDALRQFNTNNKAAELMLSDASQAVFKMKGLLSSIAGDGQQNLASRAALMDMSRSVARAVFLDADAGEDFTKVATAFAGVSDMLDRSATRLAAAAKMPVTLLMGQAPAGLQATGASDIRFWYDGVKSFQTNEVQPRIERLVKLVVQAKGIDDDPAISFPSLWQESPTERALRRKTVAETDAIYLLNEVLTPEEVTENRFGGDEYSDETRIDMLDRPVPAPLPPKPLPGAPMQMPNNGASGLPTKVPPFPVDQGQKPGNGRLPKPVGPTVGNPWPAPAIDPRDGKPSDK